MSLLPMGVTLAILLDTVAYHPTLGARLFGGEDEVGRQPFLLVELTVFFLLLNRKLH